MELGLFLSSCLPLRVVFFSGSLWQLANAERATHVVSLIGFLRAGSSRGRERGNDGLHLMASFLVHFLHGEDDCEGDFRESSLFS